MGCADRVLCCLRTTVLDDLIGGDEVKKAMKIAIQSMNTSIHFLLNIQTELETTLLLT